MLAPASGPVASRQTRRRDQRAVRPADGSASEECPKRASVIALVRREGGTMRKTRQLIPEFRILISASPYLGTTRPRSGFG